MILFNSHFDRLLADVTDLVKPIKTIIIKQYYLAIMNLFIQRHHL